MNEVLAILAGIALGIFGSIPAIALVWQATRQPVIDATYTMQEEDTNVIRVQ